MNVYLKCEKMWELSYREGLKPYGPDWMHFAKGSYIHELLHYYYSLIQAGYEIGDSITVAAIQERIKSDMQEAVASCTEGQSVDIKFFSDCARTVVNYVEHRSSLIDSKISEIQIERHLSYEFDNREFHGFADLIYWDGSRKVWVIRDHKSGGRNTYKPSTVFRNAQLLFYGTLLWALDGIVAEVEINFIHSDPPLNPKKTVIFHTERVAHTEATYRNYWKYILEVHERQKTQEPLRNLSACDNCAYFPICNSELRGLNADAIIRGRYARKASSEIYSEDADKSVSAPKNFVVNFGG